MQQRFHNYLLNWDLGFLKKIISFYTSYWSPLCICYTIVFLSYCQKAAHSLFWKAIVCTENAAARMQCRVPIAATYWPQTSAGKLKKAVLERRLVLRGSIDRDVGYWFLWMVHWLAVTYINTSLAVKPSARYGIAGQHIQSIRAQKRGCHSYIIKTTWHEAHSEGRGEDSVQFSGFLDE